ncbi:MAG: Hsp20/alpha crystallin family protein [Bdellovibrionales bacterium]|nr:Hsp20/alpha crystallin family protein [Bdellovibrionales bacterium]
MTIEQSIEQVEKLYQTITGRMATDHQGTYAPLNPEADPIVTLERRIEELVTLMQNPAVIPPVQVWTPPISVWENEREYMIKLDLAGVKKEDIDLSVRGNILFVSGSRKPRAPEAGYTLRLTEKTVGPFQREIVLPLGVATTRLHSQVIDGVLEIQIPKGTDDVQTPSTKSGKH